MPSPGVERGGDATVVGVVAIGKPPAPGTEALGALSYAPTDWSTGASSAGRTTPVGSCVSGGRSPPRRRPARRPPRHRARISSSASMDALDRSTVAGPDARDVDFGGRRRTARGRPGAVARPAAGWRRNARFASRSPSVGSSRGRGPSAGSSARSPSRVDPRRCGVARRDTCASSPAW